MFKQAELTANGVELIDQSSSTYNYKSVIESILSFNRESKNCHIGISLFRQTLLCQNCVIFVGSYLKLKPCKSSKSFKCS